MSSTNYSVNVYAVSLVEFTIHYLQPIHSANIMFSVALIFSHELPVFVQNVPS